MLAVVYGRSGDPADALATLRKGQAIMAQLVKLAPDNADWKSDVKWFGDQIAALTK
jgi:hypothetical protein